MAKMTVEKTQDDIQLVSLCKRLIHNFDGQELDGIQLSIKITDTYGLHIDHHILSEVMDVMSRTGETQLTQAYGYCKYFIIPQ